MICCTRMENSPAHSPRPAPAQRSVRLRRAVIRADGKRLERTAEFTDGTTRAVEMKWPDVRRVAAFRRDVLTSPVLCVAITDTRQVVVLDESMEGWQPLLDALPKRLADSPDVRAWSRRIVAGSTESYWTPLFSAGQ